MFLRRIFFAEGEACHRPVLCPCRRKPPGSSLKNCSPSTAATRGAWLTNELGLSPLRASIPWQKPGSGSETQSRPFNQTLGNPVGQPPSVTRAKRDRPRGSEGQLPPPHRSRIHGAAHFLRLSWNGLPVRLPDLFKKGSYPINNSPCVWFLSELSMSRMMIFGFLRS